MRGVRRACRESGTVLVPVRGCICIVWPSVCLEVLVEMNEPLENSAAYVNKWSGIGPRK
jgi:hypothetical protein